MTCKMSADSGLMSMIEIAEETQSVLKSNSAEDLSPENQSPETNDDSENKSAGINNDLENQSAETNNDAETNNSAENQSTKNEPLLSDNESLNHSFENLQADGMDECHYKIETSDGQVITVDDCGRKSPDNMEPIEEYNNNACGSLSLNANESEIEILCNSILNDDGAENADQDSIGDGKEVKSEPESVIHCGICNDYFNNPKLLDCFHSFCEGCLGKHVKSTYKFIYCPVCRYKTGIPKGGLVCLVDNVVVARVVLAITEVHRKTNCVVCKLHDEIEESVGQCLDCGDLMCQDCCNKHTYTRLTAKHNVVSLKELRNGKYPGWQKKPEVVHCRHHSGIVADLFCSACCIPVCKDCSRSGHKTHSCTALSDAVRGKKAKIEEKLERLCKESDIKLVDDSEESESLITEFERTEFRELNETKDKIMSIIEEKYNHCNNQLQQEFDIKRRKYGKHKRKFVQMERKLVDNISDKATFILSEGTDVETAMMEKFIVSAIDQRKTKLSKVHPKLTRKSNFPKVFINKEHLKVFSGLSFFTTDNVKRDHQETEKKAQYANAPMRVENAEVKMKIGSRTQAAVTQCNEISGVAKGKSLLDFRLPVGRGFTLPDQPESWSHMRDNSSSLLGEYPRSNLMYEYQDNYSESSSHSSASGISKMYNTGNRYNGTGSTGMFTSAGRQFFKLNLLTSIDVKIAADQKLPDIYDLTFMSYMNFAVADARNQRLKIFDLNGKLVRYIDDPGPMSVTFCAKHLVWSSQFSSVKLYNVQEQRIVRVMRVPQTANHPLTSFSNVKYLIANMEQSRIEARTINGSHHHVIQPRDRYGKKLQDISYIAAHSSDQIVCVDQRLKKVVVNTFDGNFMGEFSHDDFEPGGACIIANDHIFVTDKKNDKLILLNERAEFIRDWNTLVQAPSSVASNGMGRIIVAGNGKAVTLYDYPNECVAN